MKFTKVLVLGSGSPRRKEILSSAGFDFEVFIKPTSENYPTDLQPEQVPVFLAKQKINEFGAEYESKVVLCADTVVICNNLIFNKPENEAEAKAMLRALSGKTHKVVTGVAIKSKGFERSFADECMVTFGNLSEAEIDYYIKTCKPFDKAGAYGIQDFIGMAKIERLEGSFYTVMGLPIHRVYDELKEFIEF